MTNATLRGNPDAGNMRTIMSAAVAVMAFALVAADTHDYSTYVQLKASKTVAVDAAANPPPASYWNPEGEMDDDHAYYIPAGMTLTVKSNNQTVTPATWPGKELAIAGGLTVSVGHSRNYVVTEPPLALLPGGVISFTAAYSGIISSTIDIRSTAASPAQWKWTYASPNDKPYYPLIDGEVTGTDTESVLWLTSTVTSGQYDYQRAYRVTGGFADFVGTVVVDGSYTWLRDTSSSSFDLGGTLVLTNGATLLLDTQNPTFGGLTVGAGSTLRLDGGKVLTVKGTPSIDDTAIIIVSKVSSTSFVYDTAAASTHPTVPFLSVVGAEAAAAVDRTKLLAAVKRAGLKFSGTLASGVPRLKITETAREDGGVDFAVSHEPIVKQTDGCLSGKTPYGKTGYDTLLSDGSAVSAQKDYYTNGKNVYFGSSPYTFEGNSMTLSGMMGFYSGNNITIDDLRILDGAWIRLMNNGYATLNGAMVLFGPLECRGIGTRRITINSDMSGAGDVAFVVDVAKADEKAVAYRANVALAGDNSNYTGCFFVGVTNLVSTTYAICFTNVTLSVAAAKNLGGAREEFTFNSLAVGDEGTVSVTDSAVFSAVHRGWCLRDGARVDIAADKTVRVNETVTYGASVTKKGAGTLILGGAAKFHDAENDAATDTANGERLRVAAGALGFAATNAATGLGVTFAEGTSLSLDLSATGELAEKGAILTEAFASEAADGKVAVALSGAVEIPNEGLSVAICTVPASEATKPSFALPTRYDHHPVSVTTVANSDGTVTFKATIAPRRGLAIIFR